MTEKEIQLKANEKMTASGWLFWYPKRTWGERDIFGVFDFIAVDLSDRLHLVQLTTKNHLSHRRHKIQAWRGEGKPIGEIWAWDPKVGKFLIEKQ